MRRSTVVIALVVALLGLMTGCGKAEEIPVTGNTVVVDVRTPAEFADGHLAGAVNIDVSSPDFATRIAELPADGRYVVYCRSGNRSAQAVELMKRAGFTEVIDAGGVDDAADATGLSLSTG
jgi:rhodanese-related sulfurtransferase